nr:hypothetical protein CFP56_20537 [Quercus suber]
MRTYAMFFVAGRGVTGPRHHIQISRIWNKQVSSLSSSRVLDYPTVDNLLRETSASPLLGLLFAHSTLENGDENAADRPSHDGSICTIRSPGSDKGEQITKRQKSG